MQLFCLVAVKFSTLASLRLRAVEPRDFISGLSFQLVLRFTKCFLIYTCNYAAFFFYFVVVKASTLAELPVRTVEPRFHC